MLSIIFQSLFGSPLACGFTSTALLLAAICYWVITDPLRNIPGPLFARYNPLYLAIQCRLLRRSFVIHKLHAKYGDVVRVGLCSVSVISPGSLKTVYGARQGTIKGPFYDTIKHETPVLFSTRDPEFHGQRRRLLAGAFTTSALNAWEPAMDVQIRAWKAALTRQTSSGPKLLDLKLWSVLLTFDVISSFIFGKEFGFIKSENEVFEGIIESLQKRMETINALGNLPECLRPFFRSVVSRVDAFWSMAGESSMNLRTIAEDSLMVREEAQAYEKRNEIVAPKDMLSYLIASSLSRDSLLSEASSFVSGGSDSSATALTSVVTYLALHPDCVARLRTELDNAFPGKMPAEWVPASAELDALPYLNGCLYEGLRLAPPNSAGLQREVQPGRSIAVGPDGNQYVLPAGILVSVATYSLHRREDIFPDPEAFKPERWLDGATEDGKDLATMHAHFNSFSSGDRGCLGRKFVWAELSKAIAVLFKEFDVVLTKDESEIKRVDGFFHTISGPCKVVICRRQQHEG